MVALSINSVPAADKIIYGADDRLDLRDVRSQALLEVASSTAAMIPKWKVSYLTRKNMPSSVLSLLTLQGSMGVCAHERFAKQPAVADCSGFLVDEKTIVTAGHCISESSGCKENSWVFGYALDAAGDDFPLVSQSDVYSCKRVVRSVLNEIDRMDYAVVELDRPVRGRRPLSFRKSGKLQLGTEILVIGHPSGLPTKVAGGAQVLEYDNNVFFRANLDTYGGNSGSAVFNAETLEVEGILVRGARDYVQSPLGCLISNVVPTPRATEAVTVITNVAEIRDL